MSKSAASCEVVCMSPGLVPCYMVVIEGSTVIAMVVLGEWSSTGRLVWSGRE